MNKPRKFEGFGVKRSERGFTIPELLVVLTIMAILAAIAVPTFAGSKRNGQDGLAQTSLRTGLSAERTHYVDYQRYTSDAAVLRQIESQLDFATTDAKENGVMAAVGGAAAGSPTLTEQAVVLVSTSESGAQFCLMNIATTLAPPGVNNRTAPGTYYRKNPNPVSTPPTAVTTGQCGTNGYVSTEDGW
jgi:prepilin-type N-terminal cleavage/methylation domain-containing protein